MAMGYVAVLGESGGVCIGEREGITTASQARVGLLWSRGWQVVERGRVVVTLVVVSSAVKAHRIMEVRVGSQGCSRRSRLDCTALQEWNLVGGRNLDAAQSKRPSGSLVGPHSCGGASEYRINLVNYKVC